MPKECFVVIQEGGSSTELYLHAFDSWKNAVDFRLSCMDEGAYCTTGPCKVPVGFKKYLGTAQELLHLLDSLE